MAINLRQMPIHLRLNAVIAVLLLFSLIGLVLLLLIEARPRVLDENASMMSFTQAHIKATRDIILASADPAERLRELVADLSRLRHIEVSLLAPDAGNPPPEEPAVKGDWMTELLFAAAQPEPVQISFARDGRDYGTVLLKPNPVDEMNEVQSAIDGIVSAGLLLAIAVFCITSWMIWRALRPIHELCTAMSAMEAGRFDVDLEATGAPEIRAISRSVESLASALRKAQQENSRLAARLVRLQDDERRAIARELHDELGPHLYSARVRATALQTILHKPEPNLEPARQTVDKLLPEIAALQLANRRVLQQLSPAGLNELGICGALENLTSRWRDECPDIDLDVAVNVGGLVLDETTELTIYRVVQEALTNAYRHSKASRIAVAVDVKGADGSDEAVGCPAVIRIRVEDDGKGLEDAPAYGYGLRGMRERVTALGGNLSVGVGPMGGVQVTARVPSCNDHKNARQAD